MLNKIIIMAHLCKDPELRYTPQGEAVCSLRLASNRQYKPKGADEYKDEVCFFTAVVWGKRAENCNKHLQKGSAVFIEGRLQSRSWDNPEGKKQYAIEVYTENLQFMDRAKEGTSPEEPGESE